MCVELVTNDQCNLAMTWLAGNIDPTTDEILRTLSPLDSVVVLNHAEIARR